MHIKFLPKSRGKNIVVHSTVSIKCFSYRSESLYTPLGAAKDEVAPQVTQGLQVKLAPELIFDVTGTSHVVRKRIFITHIKHFNIGLFPYAFE